MNLNELFLEYMANKIGMLTKTNFEKNASATGVPPGDSRSSLDPAKINDLLLTTIEKMPDTSRAGLLYQLMQQRRSEEDRAYERSLLANLLDSRRAASETASRIARIESLANVLKSLSAGSGLSQGGGFFSNPLFGGFAPSPFLTSSVMMSNLFSSPGMAQLLTPLYNAMSSSPNPDAFGRLIR